MHTTSTGLWLSSDETVGHRPFGGHRGCERRIVRVHRSFGGCRYVDGRIVPIEYGSRKIYRGRSDLSNLGAARNRRSELRHFYFLVGAHMRISIGTWFVADSKENETAFPQVGQRSSTLAFQDVYWRCVACFYVTSVANNPHARHVFYTNTHIRHVDGFDMQGLFDRLDVEVIQLPITYRLPRDKARSWGNQFYILDIIKHMAGNPSTDKFVILDSDCIWNSSAEKLSSALDECGCLMYTLGNEEFETNAAINGITRQQMRAALNDWQGTSTPGASAEAEGVEYNGGELFAATHAECKVLASMIDDLWQWQSGQPDKKGFLEEAHFLSILYAARGYKTSTANPFIKRMWTAFKFNNVEKKDLGIDIWHLPCEKKSGFRTAFGQLADGKLPDDPSRLSAYFAHTMGIPRRSTGKFVADASRKINEKAQAFVGARIGLRAG
jgi:hypothetical protein